MVCGDKIMAYVTNIEKDTRENTNFRKVLYTANNSQLVVMNLRPGEEIGTEIHKLDQFIRIETGQGRAVLNAKEHTLADGFAVVIPAGTEHNIINTSKTDDLKLYTVYSPPNHLDGTVHVTREDALKDEEEHFDGRTTELI